MQEVSEESEKICHRIKEITQALMVGVGPQKTRKILPASSDVSATHFDNEKMFMIQEGAVRFVMGRQLFMLLESGDLMGLDLQQNLSGAQFSTDFALHVEEFSKQDFLNVVLGNPELSKLWLEFLNLQARLFLSVSAQQMKAGVQHETSVDHYKKGEVILKQGSSGKDVYTLVEGSAEVLVDNIKVGEIQNNHIFGALAAMTNTPRSASVIAREDCTVVSLPEDHFLDLIKSRPETVMQLCRDMAQTIISLNARVVEGVKIPNKKS